MSSVPLTPYELALNTIQKAFTNAIQQIAGLVTTIRISTNIHLSYAMETSEYVAITNAKIKYDGIRSKLADVIKCPGIPGTVYSLARLRFSSWLLGG